MIAWLCQDVEAVLRMDRGETLPQDMRSIVQVAQAYRDTIPLRIVQLRNASAEKVGYAIQDAARRGARVVAVDYLQAFKTQTNKRHIEFGNYASTLKDAATEVGVHLILVSQLSRPSDKANIDKIRPTMYDFKESGDIENMTENAVLLW